MLTCVYHPIYPPRVVEDDEAMQMKESGVWFDSPLKARAYRDKVEQDIESEAKPKTRRRSK